MKPTFAWLEPFRIVNWSQTKWHFRPLQRVGAVAKNRWLRWFAVLGLIAIAAVALLGVHKLGEMLLVAPRRIPGDWQNAVLHNPAHHGVKIERFSTFAEDGVSIHSLLVRPAVKPGRSTRFVEMRRRLAGEPDSAASLQGTVFLLHGRGGIKEDGVTIAERFAAAGLASVLIDSRGHGESRCRTVGYGTSEVQDLNHVMSAVQCRYGSAGDAGAQPFFLFGNSMGAAIALQALPVDSRLRAAVVVSPYADLSQLTGDMLRRRLSSGLQWSMPLVRGAVSGYVRVRGGFALHDICPEAAAAEIDVPTMVVHGDADALIPLAHGQRVFQAIADARKVWWSVEGGQHGDVLMCGGDDLYEEMIRFLLRAGDAEKSSATPLTLAP